MEEYNFTLGNVTNPPQKVLLMYQAVSELVREQRDIGNLKVADITVRAGIGKGTVYEYFTSKEELIANALVYEYSGKIQALAGKVNEKKDFESRCYCILDWIKDNREYNQMFGNVVQAAFGGNGFCNILKKDAPEKLGAEAANFVNRNMDLLLEEGYREGIFTQQDRGKRRMAFWAAVLEYALVIMGPLQNPFSSLGEEELRRFVYESMIKALN